MRRFDPNKNEWREIKAGRRNSAAQQLVWRIQLCDDSQHDCLIGKVNDKFFAFRQSP